MIKANEVIDEIKQHEDFTLTYRVLDLTPCGLIGVSDASLGGVDLFGYPTFIGEKSLASVGARGKSNVLDPARSQECIARVWLQKLVVWVCKWTQCSSMEIC